jgi:general secretion pathway protein N
MLFAPARWLAGSIERASGGHVLLSEPRGTIWSGSAQLQLTGGAGSTDAVALPSRLDWQLRLRPTGLVAELATECCTTRPLVLRFQPRWGCGEIQVSDLQTKWPPALMAC